MTYSFKLCQALLQHDITGNEMLAIRREMRSKIDQAEHLLKLHQIKFAEPKTVSEFDFHDEIWSVYIDFDSKEDYLLARLLLENAASEK